MHLQKFYFFTFITDFIIISDCALLMVLPQMNHRNIKRKNITWKYQNVETFNHIPIQITKPTKTRINEVPSNRSEFHFIRHLKHKRNKQLEKQRKEHRLKQSTFVSSEKRTKVYVTRTVQKKSLLKSLLR